MTGASALSSYAMDPMMVKEQPHEGEYSNSQWVEINDFQTSHVQSPAQEYNGFNFVPQAQHGMHLDGYARTMHQMYSASQTPQPIYPAQWPSMLANASSNPPSHQTPQPQPQSQPQSQPQPQPQPAPPPLAPVSTYSAAHPLPPISTHQSAPPPQQSTTRRTLTDQDRRRMCQYHEDNPSVKQTEIGAMFGVERSTVSKVLRQKDKYLFPEDGSRSPIKKAKGKFPDIERALSNWAKNHQRQGLPLSDSIIREKARVFATTVGSSDSHVKVNSNSWLEKFKQKNHLMGAKPRKEAEGKDSETGSSKGGKTTNNTSNDISPISPTGVPSPSPISASRSHDNLKTDSPDSYVDYKHGHSQSATSLASGYTDITAPSSFSGGPQSPTSPLFSPDITSAATNFMQNQNQRSASIGNMGSHRPRSQTFPMLGLEPGFGGSNDNLTPKQVEEMMANPTLETPVDEYPERHYSISSQELHHLSQPASSVHSPIPNSSPSVMAPPPNPLITPSSATDSAVPSPISPPSQDEARRALELVMTFFQHQQPGVVDPQEYITMGKLMEKLKVQGSVGELPGGMHSIDRGQKEMSRKRSIHSL